MEQAGEYKKRQNWKSVPEMFVRHQRIIFIAFQITEKNFSRITNLTCSVLIARADRLWLPFEGWRMSNKLRWDISIMNSGYFTELQAKNGCQLQGLGAGAQNTAQAPAPARKIKTLLELRMGSPGNWKSRRCWSWCYSLGCPGKWGSPQVPGQHIFGRLPSNFPHANPQLPSANFTQPEKTWKS